MIGASAIRDENTMAPRYGIAQARSLARHSRRESRVARIFLTNMLSQNDGAFRLSLYVLRLEVGPGYQQP
jgi:hypothetical protein